MGPECLLSRIFSFRCRIGAAPDCATSKDRDRVARERWGFGHEGTKTKRVTSQRLSDRRKYGPVGTPEWLVGTPEWRCDESASTK